MVSIIKQKVPVFTIGILLPMGCFAMDCGTQGTLYPIKEKSALVLIQERLSHLEASGEIERHQTLLKSKALRTLERPKVSANLAKATQNRTFEKDISVSVPVDLKDPEGKIIQKAGTKINPLDNPWVSTRKALIFLDGDDKDQVEWALKEREKSSGLAKLVLIKGPVMQLMRDYEIPFYFDQSGRLTAYFGFQYLPAMVYQKGNKLMISEIKVE